MNVVPDLEPVVATGAAAEYLGVTPRTVVRWCETGMIDHIRLPSGHRRIPVRVLEALKVPQRKEDSDAVA